MRTARKCAAGEAMSKDSVLENHGTAKIRRRARTSGTTAPDAPGVDAADARDGARAIPPAEPMEKIMNQHAVAKEFSASELVRANRPNLGFDMAALSINELAAVFESMRTLSDVATGIVNQPRLENKKAGAMFDDLIELFHEERSRAVDEVALRTPRDRGETNARNYVIVANSIYQNDPIDDCLAAAKALIGRRLLPGEGADQRWKQPEQEANAEGSLLQAIDAYYAGLAAFNALTDPGDGAEADAAIAATYGSAIQALEQWGRPAESREAAIEALKVAKKEAAAFKDSAIVGTMAAVALGFFENELANEDAGQGENAAPNENSFTPAAAEESSDREWEKTDRQSSRPKAYNLHDLHSDVHHLHDLLGTIKDILDEMPYERDGKRDVELDRVSALNWIATDRCCQLADLIENHYAEIGTTCTDWRSAKAS